MSDAQPEQFLSSRENGLTPAGSEFLLGWLANRYPDDAAEALAALRVYAATTDSSEYWLTESEN